MTRKKKLWVPVNGSAATEQRNSPNWLSARDGLPSLEVLVTSSAELAHVFLQGWQGCAHFGLDIEYRPFFTRFAGPSPSALLQIACGPRVLLFDLYECRRQGHSLPSVLQEFLEDDGHTFYGMGVTDDLSRLALEYDCVCRGVDFNRMAHLRGAGGLVRVCNCVLGTDARVDKKVAMSNWERRPLSPEQVYYAAADAYLSWALAMSCLHVQPIQQEGLVTKKDLFRIVRNRVKKGFQVCESSKHDWCQFESPSSLNFNFFRTMSGAELLIGIFPACGVATALVISMKGFWSAIGMESMAKPLEVTKVDATALTRGLQNQSEQLLCKLRSDTMIFPALFGALSAYIGQQVSHRLSGSPCQRKEHLDKFSTFCSAGSFCRLGAACGAVAGYIAAFGNVGAKGNNFALLAWMGLAQEYLICRK